MPVNGRSDGRSNALRSMIRTLLTAPEYAASRRAVLPSIGLVASASWLAGWGWWSLAVPFAVIAGIAAVGGLAWLAARALDPDRPAVELLVPLHRPDGSRPAPPPTLGDLESLTMPGPSGRGVQAALYLTAWGVTVPLGIQCEQVSGPEGVWPDTARAIASVHGWGAVERAAVRELLLRDARESLTNIGEPCRLTAETVEAEVSVQSLVFSQTLPARAGTGLLYLMPSWEPEHGAAVVIRDGRPVDIINGLTGDPDEVFAA